MREKKTATVEEELAKNPQLRVEDIQIMRQWVSEEFPLPSITDILLVQFLHCSNYNIEEAKCTLVKYYNAIYSTPRLFLNRDPTSNELQRVARAVGIVLLDGLDRDGNLILFHRLLDTDPSQYDMEAAMKYGTMVCLAWMKEHGTAPGIVLIYDQKGFGMGHIARGSLFTARAMVHYVQDCVPFNVKGIHVINANALFESLLGFFKPFMRASLIHKIQAHREGNMEDLFKNVPQAVLPAEYGGNDIQLAEMSQRMLQHLINEKDYFEEEDRKAFEEMEKWKNTRPEGVLGRIASWFKQGTM